MKKLIFYSSFFTLMFLFFNAGAQNKADSSKFTPGTTVGIRGGLSIPNLTGGGSSSENPLNTGYSSRLGADVAIDAEFRISKLFSIQPALEYSSQGGKKNGMQAFPTPSSYAPYFQPYPAPTYLYANFNNSSKLNYLMLPVLAKFGWDFSKSSPLRFYLDAGPFFGLLLSAKQTTSGSSDVYTLNPSTGAYQQISPSAEPFNATTDIKDDLHTFNFGIEGNVGFAYKLHNGAIFIEGGGNYGFLNIQKGTANGKNETGAGTVAIGYSFSLD